MSDMSAAPPADDQGQPQDDDANEVCVRIELNTQTGEIKVGMESDNDQGPEDEAAEDANMQPARNIDDAMRMAKDLLESGGESKPEDNQAFEQGYTNVRGGGQ